MSSPIERQEMLTRKKKVGHNGAAMRKPPKKFVPRLKKADVLACYEGNERRTSEAFGISAQAVNQWGKFIPDNKVYQAIALNPSLDAKKLLVAVRYKRVIEQRVRFVKVRA